ETGLPRPSYDLWEERWGVHTFTVCAVHAGLVAAARFAEAFGEEEPARRYRTAAEEVAAGLVRHLFHSGEGRFARMATRDADGYTLDMTPDSSLYALFAFGPLSARDPRVAATMEAVRSRLWVRTHVGGMARYQNDHYQR